MNRESDQPSWGFLRSKRWAGYTGLVVVFSIVCALLGQWQFDRRAQARAEIARIDANYANAALPLEEVLPSLDAYSDDDDKWQTVEMTGEYEERVLLVRNRPNQQSVGFDMLALFRTDSGNVFVVNRGWIDAGNTPEEPGKIVAPPEGRVTVHARLKESEPEIPGRETSGDMLATINLNDVADLVEQPTYTGGYGLLSAEFDAATEEPLSAEAGILQPKPERDEGPHLSYALQWYVFIIMAWIGLAYAIRMEYRSLYPQSERTKRQDKKTAERKQRRGLDDGEIEDALLDAHR